MTLQSQWRWPWQTRSLRAKGLLVAAIQVNLLMLIGCSFWIDRITRPRAWVATEPVDPNLPIRGRYISLRPVVPLEAGEESSIPQVTPSASNGSRTIAVRLKVHGNRLVAFEDAGGALHSGWQRSKAGAVVVALQEPLAFFIPPDVKDPSIRVADDPLWVEVTVPRSGLPRPIQLGEEHQGQIVPLGLRSREGKQ